MDCRIVLAKHSLFDIHCGMFLSLRYILIVKYTTLIFQSGPGNGEQIWQQLRDPAQIFDKSTWCIDQTLTSDHYA